MIPITDHLPIALRAYADAPKARKPRRGIGASPWTLTFDCETSTEAGQSLRFGSYQLRNGERLIEAGLFYDPDGVSADELATLTAFAKREKLHVRTRDEFADDVLFRRAYQLRARIVGFNLPFDISRLAIDHGPARGAMYGGFTFTVARQKFWPNIRVKHLARRCALIDFAAPFRQRNSRGQRNREMQTPVQRGYFVDVSTLSASLLSQGFTLGSLSRFLNVPHPKLEFDEFDGPLTDTMLAYAVRDVQTTWECYAALLEKLDRLGMADLRPEESLARRALARVICAKWASPLAYDATRFPTRNAGLHNVQLLWGALRNQDTPGSAASDPVRFPVHVSHGLHTHGPVALCHRQRHDVARCDSGDAGVARQRHHSGFAIAGTVAKAGNACAGATGKRYIPVRAAYEGEAIATIGANYLSSAAPQWFTLADCIASKLLTGKASRVLEAIAYKAGPMQPDLCPINVSGNPQYRVDPAETDLFQRVIELRKATQARMASASGDERDALDGEQHALKICANSTSYGIWMQVNVSKKAQRFTATVIGHDGKAFARETDKAEKPGEYFHPLLASLITGAARLMLAITECQIANHGLEWAFCDTDSMAIAKPDTMTGDEFRQRVSEIADWFAALNPYGFDGSILKIES